MSDSEIRRLLLLQALQEDMPESIMRDAMLTTNNFGKKFRQALKDVGENDDEFADDDPVAVAPVAVAPVAVAPAVVAHVAVAPAVVAPVVVAPATVAPAATLAPARAHVPAPAPTAALAPAPVPAPANTINKAVAPDPIGRSAPKNDAKKKQDETLSKDISKHVITPHAAEDNFDQEHWKKRINELESKTNPNIQKKKVDWSDIDIKKENEDPSARRSKTEILRKLYRSYGGIEKANSLGISMNMSLAELRFEEQDRQETVEEDETVASFLDWAKIFFGLIERINAKCGNLLKLEGWADSMTSQMGRLERPLRLIYRRYYGKRKANPVYDILFIILSSMFMYHIGNRRSVSSPDDQMRAPVSAYGASVADNLDKFPAPSRANDKKGQSSSGGLDMSSILGMVASAGLFK